MCPHGLGEIARYKAEMIVRRLASLGSVATVNRHSMCEPRAQAAPDLGLSLRSPQSHRCAWLLLLATAILAAQSVPPPPKSRALEGFRERPKLEGQIGSTRRTPTAEKTLRGKVDGLSLGDLGSANSQGLQFSKENLKGFYARIIEHPLRNFSLERVD
jgi:hypothetical protein